ncbi:acyl-CoA carboxylase epsilon subunit [Nonomuraea sp. SBT364]|uniref:acyl-CoA carboxylase epsilon subunit n=1 Tax=Nonomuraea sp. SBT364 TaxID=1580530 RepID=UPI00066DB5CF|nr:acyl-CoA carboxylase epsilon subunit [Nonomuraea sp. SBT364]
MELTAVRGNATPEELEAVERALTRLMARARARDEEQSSWSDPAALVRRPLTGGWRLSGWAG